MSALPKQVFENQAAVKDKLESVDKSAEENEVFLHIVSEGEEYLIPLTDVNEIAEYQQIKPYPLVSEGHIGIIHLRGNVIPVVAIHSSHLKGSSEVSAKRIVVLRSQDGEKFAVLATAIKKVSLKKEDTQNGEIVTYNDRPVETLTAGQIMSQIEAIS